MLFAYFVRTICVSFANMFFRVPTRENWVFKASRFHGKSVPARFGQGSDLEGDPTCALTR